MNSSLPQFYRIDQAFDARSITDVEQSIREQYASLSQSSHIRPGETVAVAVGSRGIDRVAAMVKATIACLRKSGGRPFVIPAMGSHGGASAAGQKKVLEALGITEASVGAPIIARMEVKRVGSLPSGADVFLGLDAVQADHLVVINRVKPHTAFRGTIESGLCKMLAVGCGKQKGASNMHAFGLEQSIEPAAEMILANTSILFGIAVVENAFGKIHSLQLAPPQAFAETDEALLHKAWQLFSRLPVADLDILVVQEMGKDISGTGMDPNVIGNWRRFGGPRQPDYRTIIVLQLTPGSKGNGAGIGMADLTTRRMLKQVDWEVTYGNALTSGIYRSALAPIGLAHDKEAICAALSHVPDHADARIILIRNTKSLDVFWATAPVLKELAGVSGLSISDLSQPLSFDPDGFLIPFAKKI
jgi:hypothetical protein